MPLAPRDIRLFTGKAADGERALSDTDADPVPILGGVVG